MRIRFDADKCEGHGRCYSLAPELFDSDDDGYAVMRNEGEVPAGMENSANLAVSNCPEYALEIEP